MFISVKILSMVASELGAAESAIQRADSDVSQHRALGS